MMDFSALSGLEMTFTSGSPNGAQQSVEIGITDDNALEGDHEFTVQLVSTNPSGSNVMIGAQSNTTVTITDNEGDSSLKRRVHMRVQWVSLTFDVYLATLQ